MYVEYKSRRLPVSWYLSTSPERDLTDAATFTSARCDPGAVQSKVCKLPAEFLTPDACMTPGFLCSDVFYGSKHIEYIVHIVAVRRYQGSAMASVRAGVLLAGIGDF